MNILITEQQITDLKAHLDLRDLAAKHTALRRESAKEWSGPCPKCGGRDRFHVAADFFFCRQCHAKMGDAIAFVQWLGLAHDFRSAVAYLSGAPASAATAAAGAAKGAAASTKTQQSEWNWKNPKWQAAMRAKVAQDIDRLHGAEGKPGRDYLAERGITLETALAWNLGYGLAYDSGSRERFPALVMPWTGNGIIKAVQYRFIAHPQGKRFGQEKGGERTVYGADLLGRHWHTLIALEGELNAVSAWQALAELYQSCPDAALLAVDVVSFGSENSDKPEPFDLARRYRRVIIWADKESIAAKWMAAIPGAEGMRSVPLGDGGKLDANLLLRAGRLASLLAVKLGIDCSA